MKRLAAHDGTKPLREILPPVLSIKLCRDPRHSNKRASSWSLFTVPDPDLEIGGGGESRGPVSKRNVFGPSASVWSKNKGWGAPGPFRWIRHWFLFSLRHTLQVSQFVESITSTLFSCWFISLKKKRYSYPLLTIS